MQIIRLLLTVFMLCISIWQPSLVLAQSDLLPEKTDNELSQQNLLPEKTQETTTQNNDGTAVKPLEESAFENNSITWILLAAGLLLLAFILLFLEIAVIPGFGAAGISGMILLIASLAISYWKLSMITAVIVTFVAMVGLAEMGCFLFFIFPKTKMGKTFILDECNAVGGNEISSEMEKYIGSEGVAITYLRPSGIAKFGDDRVDVITEGGYAEKGSRIKAIKTNGGRLIVSPIEE